MTLEDLIALNDEIAALTRAGVPLEAGLAAMGGDMPGRLGRVAAAWARRTARGEPLDQAIIEETGQLPPAFRAVVQAGLRAGRLPAALESVAASARRLAETHRAVLVAATYPLFVFLVVCGGFAFISRVVAPRLAEAFFAFHVPGYRFVAALAWIGRWAWYWAPGIAIVVVLLLAAWWFASTRASTLYGRRSDWLFGWLPWVGSMLRCSRTAAFLEILALLVENHTPLAEAVGLAGEASGDPQTLRGAAVGGRARAGSNRARPRRAGVSALGRLVDAGGPPRRRPAAGAAAFGGGLSAPRPPSVRPGARVPAGLPERRGGRKHDDYLCRGGLPPVRDTA